MDTKNEDTDARTAPEAPAMPAPGEPGPGPSAVPSVPLHGPVDVVDDSLEGLQSAFRALSAEEVDTKPVRRKREREKDAGKSMADKGVDHGHDPTSGSTFEGAPSASGLHVSPSPTTTTRPTPDLAAATSTPITTPPTAEGTGLTGMPTYPAYGVDPSTTAFPEATTASEPVASSSAPRWYAADYHHPLPTTGAYVDVPGDATPSGLRRGHESCGSRSRGSERSSNRSLTRSEINEVLRGATSEYVQDLTEEIRAKLEPLSPPQVSPTVVGVSPHRVQANHPNESPPKVPSVTHTATSVVQTLIQVIQVWHLNQLKNCLNGFNRLSTRMHASTHARTEVAVQQWTQARMHAHTQAQTQDPHHKRMHKHTHGHTRTHRTLLLETANLTSTPGLNTANPALPCKMMGCKRILGAPFESF